MTKNSRLVYSTDRGKISNKETTPLTNQGASDGIVRLARESKGRGGKPVTLIKGLPLSGAELKSMAKKMKQLCGVGGTIKEGVIEIQGEQRDKLKSFIEQQGYVVKISGG